MSLIIDDPELIIEKKDGLAVISLNRPETLNALSLEMIRLISIGFKKIAKDDDIKAVAITGKGGKAFCAGGDVKLAAKLGMAFRRGEISNDIADLYFKEEYRLDLLIHHFEKPVIAIMDGITMGGGVGIAYPATYRVATEKTVFAMPEVNIGFFPDVGGTYYLQKWPGRLGLFAAVSGYRFERRTDLAYLGISTHTTDSDNIPALLQDLQNALADTGDDAAEDVIEDVLSRHHHSPEGQSEIEQHADLLNDLFAHDSFEDVYAGFHDNSTDFTREISKIYNEASPTSIKVTFAYYKMNEGADFDTIMNRDINLVRHFVQGQDFYEGIRARLIDKREPAWQPARLSDVTDDVVNAYLGDIDKPKEKWIL